MARSDDEVAAILLDIYRAEFGGKTGQRFLLSWADLRTISGFGSLYPSRVQAQSEACTRRRLYLLDLGEGDNGHMVAVVKTRTVNRWRRVPKRIVDQYRMSQDDDTEGDEDDAE